MHTVQLEGNLMHACGCAFRNVRVVMWAPLKLYAGTHTPTINIA